MSEQSHQVFCDKLAKQAEGLLTPPAGRLGQRVYEHISQEAWNLWLQHQTMLINEYRLSLIDPKARDFLNDECERFLFGGESTRPPGYTPIEDEQTKKDQ